MLRPKMDYIWPTDNSAVKSQLLKRKAEHGCKSIPNGYIGKIYYISFFYKQGIGGHKILSKGIIFGQNKIVYSLEVQIYRLELKKYSKIQIFAYEFWS